MARVPVYLRPDQWRTIQMILTMTDTEMSSAGTGSVSKLAIRIARADIRDILPVIAAKVPQVM
jgi:hypothetical protein